MARKGPATRAGGGASAAAAMGEHGQADSLDPFRPHRRHSPAWRRGPASKPHLCNACGVRYLNKGTLDSYMPGSRGGGGEKGREVGGASASLFSVFALTVLPLPIKTGDYLPRRPPTRPPVDFSSDSDRPRYSARRARHAPPLHAPPLVPPPPPRAWSDYVSLAITAARLSPRTAPALIRAATAAATRDTGKASPIVVDLSRAGALFYGNRHAALRLLTDLADAESLLALTGGGHDAGAVEKPRQTVPAWQPTLTRKLEAAPAASTASVVSACRKAALLASKCGDGDVAVSLVNVAEAAATMAARAARAAALSVLTRRGRLWEMCDACGRTRLAARRPPPHEPFMCGGVAALLPNRTCDDPDDGDADWIPPPDATSPDAADAAATADPVPRARRSGHGVPVPVALATTVDGDLRALPGWRKVVCVTTAAAAPTDGDDTGTTTIDTRVDIAYVAPDGGVAVPTAAEAAAVAGVALPPRPPQRVAPTLPPRPALRVTVPPPGRLATAGSGQLPSSGGCGRASPPSPSSPRVAVLAAAAAAAAAAAHTTLAPRPASPATPSAGRRGAPPHPPPNTPMTAPAPRSPRAVDAPPSPSPPPTQWRGAVATPRGDGPGATLFELEGVLPSAAVAELGAAGLRVVAVRSRRDVFAASASPSPSPSPRAADGSVTPPPPQQPAPTPFLLHLRTPTPAQRVAAGRLEECRLAIVVCAAAPVPNGAPAPPCYGLVPHNNPLHALHFVGVRVGCVGQLPPPSDAKAVAALLASDGGATPADGAGEAGAATVPASA